MSKINAVLLTWDYEGEHLKDLYNALKPAEIIHLQKNDKRSIEKALEVVDVALIDDVMDKRYITAKKLKWVQFMQSGIDQLVFPETFEKPIIVTTGAGCTAHSLAEHVLFFILSLNYRSYKLYEMQKLRLWCSDLLSGLSSVRGKTLGIIGYGNIGREAARLAKAIGMNVVAYKRSLEINSGYLDKLYCAENGDNIDELLNISDFVLIAVALTDKTYRMIGEKELGMMKSTAYIINISRGSIINEKALIEALYNKTIAGAGLDTTEREPLPKDSPLWHAPDTIITPHYTPTDSCSKYNMIRLLEKNIKLFKEDKPMINVVTRDDIYSNRF